jgi:ferritin-like metal-binding protein YciE
MPVETLDDLFLETLKDIYFAEKQILKALPKMAKAADTDDLRQAFEHHRTETQGQIQRLESVFETLDTKAKGKTCHAIMGIIEEAQEIMSDVEDDRVRDAGMIGAAQAVEHFEISRYGTLISWARRLGNEEAANLLGQNLEEEKNTDRLLTDLAENAVNADAEAAESHDDGVEDEDDEMQASNGAHKPGRKPQSQPAAARSSRPASKKAPAKTGAAKSRASR